MEDQDQWGGRVQDSELRMGSSGLETRMRDEPGCGLRFELGSEVECLGSLGSEVEGLGFSPSETYGPEPRI